MSAATVTFTAGGPKPGSTVFFVVDGAVHRGRVAALFASLEAGADPEHPRMTAGVSWPDVDGEEHRRVFPLGQLFEHAADACAVAFAKPAPESWA